MDDYFHVFMSLWQEVVNGYVRWYLAYPLSYRHLEEMMAERGVHVDHSTVQRWVIKYTPQLEKAFHKKKRSVGSSWRLDETYIKVKGQWKYLYRAVDKSGQTVDFMLTARRDEKAARRFLNKAIRRQGLPEKITIDKSGANTAAIERLRWLGKHLIELSRTLKLVLPIHPRTYQALKINNLCGLLASKVKVIEPVSYLDMVELILACNIVIIDSGGLQKEAFFFCKPCVTLRDETEWQELLVLGVNQLFNPCTDDLNNVVEQLLNKKLDFLAKPYGNGNAGAKIAKFLSSIIH